MRESLQLYSIQLALPRSSMRSVVVVAGVMGAIVAPEVGVVAKGTLG